MLFVSPGTPAVSSHIESVGSFGRQRRLAGQTSIAIQDGRELGTVNKIVIQLATTCFERVAIGIGMPHIPSGSISRMEKDAVAAGTHKERHGTVIGFEDVIRADNMWTTQTAPNIHFNLFTSLIDKVHAFAETEKLFFREELLLHGYRILLL